MTVLPSVPNPGSRRWPSRGDVLLAVVFIAITLGGAALYPLVNDSRTDQSHSLDLLGVLLIMLVAGPIAARRWPLPALGVSMAAQVVYHGLEYPPEVVLPAFLVLLYNVGVTGSRARALVTAVVAAVAVLLRLRFSTGSWQGGDAVDEVGWALAALAIGQATRGYRAHTAAVEERARRAEQSRDQEARRRVAEERVRIARDLHDVMAHNIAVISMQSSVAAHLIDQRADDDAELAELSASLHRVADASRATLAELRAMLGVLRGFDADEGREPTPGLGRLADLVESARAAGVSVEMHEAGQRRALPTSADVTAYRIIQEALTNVGKHAPGATATVVVEYAPTELRLRVSDDGQPGEDHIRPGHGLIGMTERAQAVGGSVSAGPAPGGGFVVDAVLQTPRAPTETPVDERNL